MAKVLLGLGGCPANFPPHTQAKLRHYTKAISENLQLSN